MFKFIKGIFSSGATKSLENIASEWIQTDIEKAEAKTLMIKTLDPNGLMRRNLSTRVTGLYTLYIVVMLVLLIAESFGIGGMNGEQLAVSVATDKVTDLFVPITAMFSTIVGASFGVNYASIKKDN